tara:strand:+ start:30 stop:1862 length:1833 start_codon:yes stop_codon:yes gene_type:complete
MWYCPEKYELEQANVNAELAKLKGDLDNKEARISLAKFLRANLGFTTELLTGIKLAPFQEITLRGLMNRNFSMCVWGRGCGKTFIASVFAVLQCIFEPGTKILIAGPTFRTARFIFNNIEKMVQTKGAELLRQAFNAKPSKRNDQYEWLINGGSITAVPLSGEKIRGFRANILLLDEYLLLPEEIIKTVLMPFLVAPQNMKERIEIREIEDDLIKKGLMQESERMVFENDSKMVALSSASYTFENLYKQYKEWQEKIYSDDMGDAKYFISQMGYESLPNEMIDQTIIEEAQDGGTSNAAFQREYCAQFTDGSDSYFSAKKMHECTIPDGEAPTTLINGRDGGKYILAIDPSFSNSPSSDYFAMSLLEIDDETEHSTLVHSYAVAGGDLKDHIKYLYYLVTCFNIEMLIIDNAGYQFIDSANESDLFTKNKINLKFFDFDSDKEGQDYNRMLKEAKRQYNLTDKRIVFKQNFSTKFIRTANENLQASIDHKRIWFASKTTANEAAFTRATMQSVPVKYTPNENILDLIEWQDAWVYQTKKQCALVEVKSTAKGTQTFDLPQHLKRSTSATRARKDNYTTLMLASWATKCYYDIIKLREDRKPETFSPIMIQ